MVYYKFFYNWPKSNESGTIWKIGEWQHVYDEACYAMPLDAFMCENRVKVLAEMESDKLFMENSRLSHDNMRVIRAWKWTNSDSAKLAVFAAYSVLHIFEQARVGDNRPRKALEVANDSSRIHADNGMLDAAIALRVAIDEHANPEAIFAASSAYYAAMSADDLDFAFKAAMYAITDALKASENEDEATQKISDWILNHIPNLEELAS